MVGLDKDKMRFFDLDMSANRDMVSREQAMSSPVKEPQFRGGRSKKVEKDFSGISV
jgi:hypothetical protein